MVLFILVQTPWDYLGGCLRASVCECACARSDKLSGEGHLLQILDMTNCFQEDILAQEDRLTGRQADKPRLSQHSHRRTRR